MSTLCQPLPRPVAEEMLQVVARAICDRPGDNPAQRESRTRQMVHTTLGFEPRDGLEYMLSTLVFAHFNLILDSMHDVFNGQMDLMKARTKTTIVALDRSMLALVKELREAGRRPLAEAAVDEKREETAAEVPDRVEALVETAETVAESVGPAEAAPTPGPARAPGRDAARVVPLQTPRRPKGMPSGHNGAAGAPLPRETDADTLEDHIAAFQKALSAAEATLSEARALDGAQIAVAHGEIRGQDRNRDGTDTACLGPICPPGCSAIGSIPSRAVAPDPVEACLARRGGIGQAGRAPAL